LEQKVTKGLFEVIKEEKETPSTKKHKNCHEDFSHNALDFLQLT
jgi:hypothetical protein